LSLQSTFIFDNLRNEAERVEEILKLFKKNKIEKLKISAPTSEGWNVSDIRHLLQLALQALHVGGRV